MRRQQANTIYRVWIEKAGWHPTSRAHATFCRSQGECKVYSDPRYFGVYFTQPVLDTLLLSEALHPNQESHALETIAERLGIKVTARHDALGDAVVTAEIFLRMIPLLAAQGSALWATPARPRKRSTPRSSTSRPWSTMRMAGVPGQSRYVGGGQEAKGSGGGAGFIGWRELMRLQLLAPRPYFADLQRIPLISRSPPSLHSASYGRRVLRCRHRSGPV